MLVMPLWILLIVALVFMVVGFFATETENKPLSVVCFLSLFVVVVGAVLGADCIC